MKNLICFINMILSRLLFDINGNKDEMVVRFFILLPEPNINTKLTQAIPAHSKKNIQPVLN